MESASQVHSLIYGSSTLVEFAAGSLVVLHLLADDIKGLNELNLVILHYSSNLCSAIIPTIYKDG